jgi:hypothetical protein
MVTFDRILRKFQILLHHTSVLWTDNIKQMDSRQTERRLVLELIIIDMHMYVHSDFKYRG